MLHTITSALFELGINIQLAKISTPGAQVVDIFYVTDLSGEKLISYDRHEEVRVKLLECLSVCVDLSLLTGFLRVRAKKYIFVQNRTGVWDNQFIELSDNYSFDFL